jgi:type II secretory pathway predicted ATPase ExeA
MLQRLQAHRGFTKLPFGRDLAPSMLHKHAAPNRAVARINWTVRERALGVVTGEAGAGKTVAVRAALSGLDEARPKVIYLGNPAVGARGIHFAIVTALGQAPRFHTAALIPQAADALIAEYDERGRNTVLVIDEAHLLSHAQLEAIRMLTNHEMDSRSASTCLLIGQPTLRRRIKFGELAGLDQRIAMRFHMNGMSRDETAGYITHHLKLAGRADTLFSGDAITLIHQTSRGFPRMVNNLARQAPLAALSEDKAIVDESSARTAVSEVTAE